jgi:hypothetical protein
MNSNHNSRSPAKKYTTNNMLCLWRNQHLSIYLYDRLLLIQKNIDSLMPIVMGANSLLETQQSSLDTKYVLRLTILALVFVPISSNGLYSMAENYLPGQPEFWVVASVCVPLLFTVHILAFGGVVVEKLRAWGRVGRKESFIA